MSIHLVEVKKPLPSIRHAKVLVETHSEFNEGCYKIRDEKNLKNLGIHYLSQEQFDEHFHPVKRLDNDSN